ncbi:MAG: hypothetical protein HWN66_13685 [Candidatus Helarchaeota archaeon]|nr:hypothetical protein [Candidatus Helarchaeota archaeon]
MAKTRKKELAFYLRDPEKRTEFLEIVRKKVTMVNLRLMVKQDKVRITVTGPHESVRYAIQLIKRIQSSLIN